MLNGIEWMKVFFCPGLLVIEQLVSMHFHMMGREVFYLLGSMVKYGDALMGIGRNLIALQMSH